MPEPDHRLVPVPSAQLALAANHLALLNKILPPAVHGPVSGLPWEIEHLGLKMIWIEPGTFLMQDIEKNYVDHPDDFVPPEEPALKATISQGYWLAATQVTQSQWETVMGNNPSFLQKAGKDTPVENVSWDDAMECCKAITEQERAAGRLSAKEKFTLPTEAQWEYACRAGTTGNYAGDLDAMAWYYKNSKGTTHPVGTKQPNAWGLYDMHGNVFEWCWDWYAIYPGGAVTDPSGPPAGSSRVFRGGCWVGAGGAAICRSAYRGYESPDIRADFLGFRLALSSVP